MLGVYTDKHVVALRDIGRGRLEATGIRAYTDPVLSFSGTLVATPTEAQVVTGGTVIITLGQAKWVESGAVFNAVRQAIIDALDSAQSEAAGWDATVKAALAVTAVARTSDTVVTVTVPATAGYAIDANEAISFLLPRTATDGGAGTASVAVMTIVAS